MGAFGPGPLSTINVFFFKDKITHLNIKQHAEETTALPRRQAFKVGRKVNLPKCQLFEMPICRNTY